MISVRVIPSLLIDGLGLVKTTKFKNAKYVGDPINAIKIFNDKEVDELVILDIMASKKQIGPNFDFLSRINREAFMPLGYGGGIRNVSDVNKILELGYEKVIIDSAVLNNINIVKDSADQCGSSSVVVCVDVKKNVFNKFYIYDYLHNKKMSITPTDWVRKIQDYGAGEVIIHFSDREGTYNGYDNEFLKEITSELSIPVVALGGAGNINDFIDAVKFGGVSAVAAGNMFIYQRPHNAVLISYPERSVLEKIFQ